MRTFLKVAWMNVAILTTLLVGIECSAFGYYFVRRTLAGYDPVGAYVEAQVAKMPANGYPNPADRTWFGPYWREFNESTYAAVESVSYSNWHRYPFKGMYINVGLDGRRATWNQPPKEATRSIRVALLGGSTMWGTGARDEFTIASYVSKMLAETYPRRFDVVNYGQDGYVGTQEVITLLREIQRDSIPDIAVFYDGYNEAFTAFQTGAAGFPMNEDNRTREFNILHPSRSRDFYFEVLSRTNTFQLTRGVRTALSAATVEDPLKNTDLEMLAHDVVRVYFRNIEFVTAIEKRFGVVAQFFWQPSVYTKARPTEREQSIIRISGRFAPLYRQIHDAMKQVYRTTGPANFRDISNVLDEYVGTAFIDPVHATEVANEAVAREIVAGLKSTLELTMSVPGNSPAPRAREKERLSR